MVTSVQQTSGDSYPVQSLEMRNLAGLALSDNIHLLGNGMNVLANSSANFLKSKEVAPISEALKSGHLIKAKLVAFQYFLAKDVKVSENEYNHINSINFSKREQKELYLSLLSSERTFFTEQERKLFIDKVDENISEQSDEAQILEAFIERYQSKLSFSELHRLTSLVNSRVDHASKNLLKKRLSEVYVSKTHKMGNYIVGKTKKDSGKVEMRPHDIFKALLYKDMDSGAISALTSVLRANIPDVSKTLALKELLDHQKLNTAQLLSLVEIADHIEKQEDKQAYLQEISRRSSLPNSVYLAVFKKSSEIGIAGYLSAHKLHIGLVGGLALLTGASYAVRNNLEAISNAYSTVQSYLKP